MKLNVFVGIHADEVKDKFEFKWELEEEVLYAWIALINVDCLLLSWAPL